LFSLLSYFYQSRNSDDWVEHTHLIAIPPVNIISKEGSEGVMSECWLLHSHYIQASCRDIAIDTVYVIYNLFGCSTSPDAADHRGVAIKGIEQVGFRAVVEFLDRHHCIHIHALYVLHIDIPRDWFEAVPPTIRNETRERERTHTVC
jgi:hypothetical protein